MANLPSQELLNKYRAEEKAAAQGTPANPEQTNAETPNPETETQPTGSEEVAGNGEASQTTQPSSESGAQPEKTDKGEDRWLKTQESFKKRLDRQERSHRKTVSALEAKIAELQKQLEGSKPELKREDFPTVEAYEKYREEEIKKSILAENQKQQAQNEEAARHAAAAQKKLDETFKTPEAKKEFQETLSDFMEDNGEWLESEEGQLYQEIIDQSPVGLLMAMAIAKSAEVTAQMKNWSKDLLFHKLSQFETALLKNAKEAAGKQTADANTQTPSKPSTNGIPSTGSVGKQQAPSKFDAKAWLHKNRPERYPTH